MKFTCFIVVLAAAIVARAGETETARDLLATSGVRGGIVVHLHCGDGKLTAALHANDSYIVQGLDSDITAARAHIESLGLYGNVSAVKWTGNLLPYVDNMVNLLVADDLGSVPMDEVTRVLTPNGIAMIGGKKIVKPRPAEMDDWTHYFYDARGNAVSHDTMVGPPKQLRWVGSPRWSRHHDRMSSLSAMVSGGGRLFYIMDQGSRVSILLPSKWILTARDAYNGTILWQKQIPTWQDQMWPLKSGPTELTRRLVTDGAHVFVTMGIHDPVSSLDPATGQVLHVYQDTKGAEEILHVNGTLYLLVNPNAWSLNEYAPKLNTGDQQRVETEYNWDQKPRDLMAVDVATGKVKWKIEGKIAPLTIAADGKHVVYYDGEKLVGLDPSTGHPLWASAPEAKRKLFEYNYAPRMVLDDKLVLYAGGDGTEKGISAVDGKDIWTAPHGKSGYRSPEDLILAGGLLWNAPDTSGNLSGIFSGRDPETGKVVKEFPPDVDAYWFHHRCYIAKATEKYILTSRTGIEFVDFNKSHWTINHWVRGACLYGVLPANGLVYAGPHDCACYPEAKLDGMNALAPATPTPHPAPESDDQRLEKGPAYGQAIEETAADAKDWPTYRHDPQRSGYSDQPLLDNLSQSWEVPLGGRLSTMTAAAGKVFVAQIDLHVLHALDLKTGGKLWHFTADSRIDSPPTYWNGRVLFGGMDGYVYCLRASDGALVWRFLAATDHRRHMAQEQLESVWPVHGSVLVENGIVGCVAGRSVFLDGGLRFIRIDAATGRKIAEVVYDDKDPETGGDLQMRHKTLQMPVGLNDILSSDGKYTYLRSQKIEADGKRIDIGPVSGDAGLQGGAQQGEGAHIFAPMGFLDDSWFHRSYWVYGKNFAGGHNGYFQAGKYAPSGRLLVFDDKEVYAFGRLPQYFKWTTTMAYQMSATSKEPPDVKPIPANAGGPKKKAAAGAKAAANRPVFPSVKFADSDKLDLANKAITIEAWVHPDNPDGVIAQYGGTLNGVALALQDGRPGFSVKAAKQGATAEAARPLDPGWHHVAGVLTENKVLRVYVDGDMAAEVKAPGLMPEKPHQGLQLGSANGSSVSEFGRSAPYAGQLDMFALFPRALSGAELTEHFSQVNGVAPNNGALVACSFDKADARDESGNGINGVVTGVETGKGKAGLALWFKNAEAPDNANKPKPPSLLAKNVGSFVKDNWTSYVPVVTHAMAMAGRTVFVAGPPDRLDEEYAFTRLAAKDKAIKAELAEQDASLEGKRGGSLMGISTATGQPTQQKVDLKSPPVWDGLIVAQGRLFEAAMDGKVVCFGTVSK
ncbi:MAG TPA: PQQ-binding-like beta-propeller repeat protein [Tepidisphaeraceae bacterium]|nr:PQQ-binding-like beta-propeller repeat protein [Tepidisphaeraceae bacterium]